MRRAGSWALLALVFVLPLALAVTGCPMSAIQQQATVANVSAQTFNAALPVVVDAYERDVRGAIDGACCTRAAMDAAVTAAKARWEPVILAWEGTRIAHDAYRVELERCRQLADAGSCAPTLPGLLANFVDRLSDARCAVRALGRADLDPFPGAPACAPLVADGGAP